MRNIFMLCLLALTIGCVSFNKNDSRYIGTALSDNSLSLRVNDALFQKDLGYFTDINVTIFGGRVMLVGIVENNTVKEDILARVHRVEGVRQVLDYIMIEGKEQGSTGFSWVIHKKIVAKLLADEKVSSNNFKVVVYRKIAYVIGEARSYTEKNIVIDTIHSTSGVMGIKDNIVVK